MSPVLTCPECGSFIRPRQGRGDHCGVWFEDPKPPTISAIISERDNKPQETISYYDGGFASSDSNIGFSVGVGGGAGIFVPIGDNTPQRSVSRVTGTVVEETSEYVIVMTHKNELVKIRPENVIKRELFKPFTFTAERKRKAIRNYVIAGSFFLLASIPLLATGSVWLWGMSAIIGVAEFMVAAIIRQRQVEK